MLRDDIDSAGHEPGFYWVKYRVGGRWEVAEFDGIGWNIEAIYLLGPRIPEPTD